RCLVKVGQPAPMRDHRYLWRLAVPFMAFPVSLCLPPRRNKCENGGLGSHSYGVAGKRIAEADSRVDCAPLWVTCSSPYSWRRIPRFCEFSAVGVTPPIGVLSTEVCKNCSLRK